MALTQSAWTSKSVKNRLVSQCTVAATTAENDAYTLKTPEALDTTLPWSVTISTTEDIDAGAVYLDLWGGWSSSFALSGNDTTVAATDGVEIGNIISTDFKAGIAAHCVRFFPQGSVTAVTTVPGAVNCPSPFPYYAFNVDASSTFDDAVTFTFTIIQ